MQVLRHFLKNTSTKTILERCYDDVWGNGIPLSNPDYINPTKFKKQGILGSMLEQVRDILREQQPNPDNPANTIHCELKSSSQSLSTTLTLPVETSPTAD